MKVYILNIKRRHSTCHNKHWIKGRECWKYDSDGQFEIRFKKSDKRIQIKKVRLSKKNMIDEGLKDYEN